ncbi:MAG: hypothetical protein AVDCRST_MAG25-2371, partial [uncultured Rubrobacteraceae bacterium]
EPFVLPHAAGAGLRRGRRAPLPQSRCLRADHAAVPPAPARAGLPERRGRDPGRARYALGKDPARRRDRPHTAAPRGLAGEPSDAARCPRRWETFVVDHAAVGPHAATTRPDLVGVASLPTSRL